jgi:hypothetical protein
LLREGLLDELQLLAHPVVASFGNHLFEGGNDTVPPKLHMDVAGLVARLVDRSLVMVATGAPGPDVLDVDQYGPAGNRFAASPGRASRPPVTHSSSVDCTERR